MEIIVRTLNTPVNKHRYLMLVKKEKGRFTEYIIDFRCGDEINLFLSDYHERNELLNNTFMVEFFDLQSIYSIANKSKFEKLSDMHYSLEELERFFVEGIAEAIFDVVNSSNATIIFSVPSRPALGRLYHQLLKKHAPTVNYTYREDIRNEVNLYVLETDRR